MKQAVVLAGGKGTRLRSVLGDVPKPLAEVGGEPLLSHHMRLLRAYGFTNVVILVDHGADQIQAWADAQDGAGLAISLVADGSPRGTAGAVLAAYPKLAAEFLVMYADTMLEVDLGRFWAWHAADPEAAASLFLHPNDHPQDSDLVEVDGSGRILAFYPYPHPQGAWLPNLVNAALYIVRRSALTSYIDAAPPLDFGKDLFPRLLADGALLRGYNSPEYIKDAGTPERLARVRKAHAAGVPRKASLREPQRAVFLDRDGTLNIAAGHIARAEDLHVFDFVGPALRRLNDAGWRSIVVTNQPVLARGEATEGELRRIHARLDTAVARHGAYFDRLFLCPHHPDAGYPGEVRALKVDCSCRKPEAGLIWQAQAALNIDLAESWFVGDSSADLGAAETAQVSSILVETGSGGLDGRHPFEAGFSARDMSAAVDFILDVYPRLARMVEPIVSAFEPGQDWFVAGLARSGKSTVAAALQREARRSGRSCEVISLDRWIKAADERGPDVFARFGMQALERAVADAACRKTGPVAIELPSYHRVKRSRGAMGLRRHMDPGTIVIWEGVVALELARLAGSSRTIQITAREDGRRTRLARFYERRGETAEAVDALYAERERDEHHLITAAGSNAASRISLDDVLGAAPTEDQA